MLPTAYQQTIHVSRYARFLEKEGRRETWEETVDRYLEFMCNEKYVDSETKNQLREAILRCDVMPSMRALMTAGLALERENLCGYNCTYTIIDHPRKFAEILYILMCGAGVGFSCERQYIAKLPDLPKSMGKRSLTWDMTEKEEIIQVEDSKEGWAEGYHQLIDNLYLGIIPKIDYSKIRPAGSRLKTMGGRASGPAPLKQLFDFTIQTFCNAKGRKLTSLEVHNIVCNIAEIVVVGGVRRCLPAYTRILTFNDPIKPIRDVTEKDLVFTPSGWRHVIAKKSTGHRSLLSIKHEHGEISCTPEHRLAIKVHNDEIRWIEAKHIKPDHYLVTPDNIKTSCSPGRATHLPKCSKLTVPELDPYMAWFLAVFQSKGFNFNGNMHLIVPGPMTDIIEQQFRRFGGKVDNSIQGKSFFKILCKDKVLSDYLDSFLRDKRIPKCIREAPVLQRVAYVQGLFDSHGLREIQCYNEDFARDIQGLALSFGVGLKINENRLVHHTQNDLAQWAMLSIRVPQFLVTFQEKFVNPIAYRTHKVIEILQLENSEKCYDIEVDTDSCFVAENILVHNSALISLSNPSDTRMKNAKTGNWYVTTPYLSMANNSAAYTEKPDPLIFAKDWLTLWESRSGERGIFNRKACENQVQRIGRRDPNFEWGTNPCSEIILRSDQCCNLTEVVIRPKDTLAILVKKVQLATILGTLQSGLTHFQFINKNWKQNCEEERLLGVSLTGIADNSFTNSPSKTLELALEQLKQEAIETNKTWASKMGINQSTAITCVKPSGCSKKETLIVSSDGILRLDEIGFVSKSEPIWQRLPFKFQVLGERGKNKRATQFFQNGLSKTRILKLESGITLQSTLNHRYRVYVNRGGWEWKCVKDIEEGDLLPYVLGGYQKYQLYPMKSAKNPFFMTEELAWVVGYIHRHGKWILESVLQLTHYTPLFIEYMDMLFGSKGYLINDNILEYQDLYSWWDTNGLIQDEIPYAVRRSPPHVIEQYMRGRSMKETEKGLYFNAKTDEWNSQLITCLRAIGMYAHKIKYHIFALKNPMSQKTALLDRVKTIYEPENEIETFDLSVPSGNAYVANSFISHNTVSQLVDCGSGIHARYAKYYIRTIRCDKKDPLYSFLKDQGIPCENEIHRPQSTAVFSFPIKSPEHALVRDDIKSAVQQLELWKLYQDHWCEHKPSVTIYVREEEWMEVGTWVWKNFDKISGVSFLPYDNGIYQQAPYQQITKEEYEEAVKKMPKKVCWEKLSNYEKEEANRDFGMTFACTSESCENVDI